MAVSWMTRVLLLVGAVGLAVVVFEGAHSLLTGRPCLGGNAHLVGTFGRLRLTDAERAAAAVHGSGPFALATDPKVAFVLKTGAGTSFGVTIEVDRHGNRVRTGPEPAPGAKRVVLLGDSVTFGFGLRDEETLARRLQEYLAVASPAGAAPPAVFTLACPGWNVWNCGRALCDAIGRLQPDVLVYTPVANDLYDAFATTESGHRSFAFDPAVGAARPHVSYEAHMALLAAQAPLLSTGDALRLRLAGGLDAIPPVSISRVTPESRRRWQGFVDVVADLARRMAHRHGHLALNLWFDDPFETMVECVVGAELPTLPMVAPFRGGTAADRLPGDAHPNAGCVDARARVLAEFLLQRGVLAGDIAALPPLAAAYRDRVASLRSPAQRADWQQQRERTWFEGIGSMIDLTRAVGPHQVYGGLEADGMAGRGVWLALRAPRAEDAVPGARLELVLELQRLPSASGLYPCELAVHVGQRPAVVVAVDEPEANAVGPWTLRVSLPGAVDPDPAEAATGCRDVLLLPSNYVQEEYEGRTRLASFHLRRACLQWAP